MKPLGTQQGFDVYSWDGDDQISGEVEAERHAVNVVLGHHETDGHRKIQHEERDSSVAYQRQLLV